MYIHTHILLICILLLCCPREATSYFTKSGFINHAVCFHLKSLKLSFLSYKTFKPAALKSSLAKPWGGSCCYVLLNLLSEGDPLGPPTHRFT